MLLVFGSLNADLLFQVTNLPAPGETVLCPHYEVAPGGKGANQAAAAAKAGAEVRFVGRAGDDDHGRTMVGKLRDAGVDVSQVGLSERPTAIAVIGIDRQGENQIIVASGANLDVVETQVDDGDLVAGTTVLCQNEVVPEQTFDLLVRAKQQGARTVLNLAPAATVPDKVLNALDVLVVNEIEASTAAHGVDEPPIDLARRLAGKHQLTCVITLGGQGAVAHDGEQAWQVGAMAIKPVDTTGAGDTFVGVLAAALDAGAAIDKALHRASVAAALACEAVGAQGGQPMQAAIDARLSDLAMPGPIG